jgi:hypothetical protein
MRKGSGLGWKGLALLAMVGLAACGGSAESEHEGDDDSPTGPSAAVTPAPQPNPTPAATPDPGTPTPAPTPAAASVAYEQDIRPILAADCLGCHGQLDTYSGAMGYVVAGNASSRLVRATQSGGSMNRYLSGDKAAKAALIRSWVVDNGAAQSR